MNRKIKQLEKKISSFTINKLNERFGKKRTENIFIGIVTGLFVSFYLLIMDLITDFFVTKNRILIIIHIIFLFLFWILMQTSMKFFEK
jgi:tetrahydromethanopterin S-methyltransferase subunit G